MIVGSERDLGVERETIERCAQLAGQEERPRVAAAAEALDSWLAACRPHAPALDRGRVELGEQRLVGLGLDSLRFAAQPTAACEVAQDAPVEEREDLHDVAIGERLGGMEDRPRERAPARVDAVEHQLGIGPSSSLQRVFSR